MSKPWSNLAFHMSRAVDDAYRLVRNQLKHGEREQDFRTLEEVKAILCQADADFDLATQILFGPDPLD